CTFAANQAGPSSLQNPPGGGGGFALGGDACDDLTGRESWMYECILWGNTLQGSPSSNKGSQIALTGQESGTLHVWYTDVQKSIGSDTSGVYLYDGVLCPGHPPFNLDWQTGHLDSDPHFVVSPPSYGPDHIWGTPDDNINLRLVCPSLCVNFGNNSDLPP